MTNDICLSSNTDTRRHAAHASSDIGQEGATEVTKSAPGQDLLKELVCDTTETASSDIHSGDFFLHLSYREICIGMHFPTHTIYMSGNSKTKLNP